jgi:DNA modification methylase
VGSPPRNSILVGDARERLAVLPPASIDCVVTSPPFYGVRTFVGGRGEIGLEPSVEEWVGSLRQVLHEVGRALKPSGSLWLDLADTYSRTLREGAPGKSLLLAPERLILALLADGWIVRNKVIWAKTNPMPTGISDRLDVSYDVVYFLVRSQHYFFDLDAIRERRVVERTAETRLGRNPTDVWPLPVANFRGPHFGTFPARVVERPVLATCPAKVCVACGAPWRTAVNTRRVPRRRHARRPTVRMHPTAYNVLRTDPELRPGCDCNVGTRPGVVLDPFFGTGTVGAVARELGRDWIGIEINPEYVRLAEQRLAHVQPRTEAA